ncbi:hypothetical protein ACX80V_16830 [Arthrobacter sp. MDT3-24]
MIDGQPAGSRFRDRVWVRVLLPDVLILLLAPAAEYFTFNYLETFQDLGYAVGLTLLGLFTFWGIWSYERTVRGEPGSVAMRDAIAATVVLVYLVVLSWALFFGYLPDPIDPSKPRPLNPVTAAMLTSFTSVTSVVVGFYFGSVALGQFAERGIRALQAQEVHEETKTTKET